MSIQIISPLVSKGGKKIPYSPCSLFCSQERWPRQVTGEVLSAGNFAQPARRLWLFGLCRGGPRASFQGSPPGQGPLEPGDASVSLNPSCAAGKQRHSPPRPAAASSRLGCRLRAARARLGPRAARWRRRRRRRGAGRRGPAESEERASRAGERGAAPGPVAARRRTTMCPAPALLASSLRRFP